MATTIDVSIPEAKLYLETLEEELPLTMAFVKSCSKQALSQGYLVNEGRSNSRRWYLNVLDSLQTGRELSFKEESDVTSSARNWKIQSRVCALSKLG